MSSALIRHCQPAREQAVCRAASSLCSGALALLGWFVLFPSHNDNVTLYLVGYSALLGGTLFEIGGFCAFLECINRPNKGSVRFDYEVGHMAQQFLIRVPTTAGHGMSGGASAMLRLPLP